MNNTKNTTPLLFHRITKKYPESWEDITEKTFKIILNEISNKWLLEPYKENAYKENWIITFDDGLDSDFNIAYPILLEKNIKAIFFLITDMIGKPGYLNWWQIEEMHNNGMIFGSHGKSHQQMTEISEKKAIDELKSSRLILQNKLHTNIDSFAFPYGYWNKNLIELAKNAGYKYIYTSQYGKITKKSNCALPRNCINSSMTMEVINKIMRPSCWMLLKWKILDKIKNLIKQFIGNNSYIKLRNLIFKN